MDMRDVDDQEPHVIALWAIGCGAMALMWHAEGWCRVGCLHASELRLGSGAGHSTYRRSAAWQTGVSIHKREQEELYNYTRANFEGP